MTESDSKRVTPLGYSSEPFASTHPERRRAAPKSKDAQKKLRDGSLGEVLRCAQHDMAKWLRRKVDESYVFWLRSHPVRVPTTRGFSALELIVAMGVAGIFSGVLYTFYHFHTYALRGQEIEVGLREGSRLALDFLVREIPLAGARPVRGSPCEGFERLTEATDQRIVFQYDYRASSVGSPPDGCPDDPNERIVYTYDTVRAFHAQVGKQPS